jgi:Lipase (class 3)
MEDVPGIGRVSRGFNVGLEEAWGRLKQIVRQEPWVVCGHSRGAAQATLLAVYGAAAGQPPAYRIVFGEPPSCDAQAGGFLKSVRSVSFCNGWNGDHDPVVDVPAYIPPLFTYQRVTPLTYLCGAPSANNPWINYPGPVCLHYMPDYQRNVEQALTT